MERKIEPASQPAAAPSATPTAADSPLAEHRIDEALEDTFPASDPPAFTPVLHTGRPRRRSGSGKT